MTGRVRSRRRFLALPAGGSIAGGVGVGRAGATTSGGGTARTTTRAAGASGGTAAGGSRRAANQDAESPIPTPPGAVPSDLRSVVELPAMVPGGPLAILRDLRLFVQTPGETRMRGFEIADPAATLDWFEGTLDGYHVQSEEHGVSVGRPVVGAGRGSMDGAADPDRASRARRSRRGDHGILLWARDTGGGMVPGPASLVALAGPWTAIERAEIGYPTWRPRASGVPRFLAHPVTRLAAVDGVSAATGVSSDRPPGELVSTRAAGQSFAIATDAEQPVLAPASGTVFLIQHGGTGPGPELFLRPAGHPAFLVRLAGVKLTADIGVGDLVDAGDRLGTWRGRLKPAIAVQVGTPGGIALVPPVRAMTGAVFEGYRGRGITTREELVAADAGDGRSGGRWVALG